MATLPKSDVESGKRPLSLDEAAAELYKIVEGHFDDLDLTEAERDERYAKATEYVHLRPL